MNCTRCLDPSEDRRFPQQQALARCEGSGREVPGVAPHVFFWAHTGPEARSAVGLSRENPTEVDRVGALVRWLTTCGVPGGGGPRC